MSQKTGKRQFIRMFIWLEDNWPLSAPFLAVFSAALLLAFRPGMDTALFLIWLQSPVYFLHQSEEYVFPGGFLSYFNKNVLGSHQADFPLTKTASLWINVPVIYIGFPLSAILAMQFGVAFGLWTAYFSIINAASHLGLFFRNGYNPGLAVSFALNIPVGVVTVGYFATQNLVSLQAHIASLMIALAIQGGLMIYGFLVLKPRITRP